MLEVWAFGLKEKILYEGGCQHHLSCTRGQNLNKGVSFWGSTLYLSTEKCFTASAALQWQAAFPGSRLLGLGVSWAEVVHFQKVLTVGQNPKPGRASGSLGLVGQWSFENLQIAPLYPALLYQNTGVRSRNLYFFSVSWDDCDEWFFWNNSCAVFEKPATLWFFGLHFTYNSVSSISNEWIYGWVSKCQASSSGDLQSQGRGRALSWLDGPCPTRASLASSVLEDMWAINACTEEATHEQMKRHKVY